jgi:hypothetical protein
VAAHRDASKIAHFKCGYPRAFCGWSTTGAGARAISHHAPRRSEDWWNSGPNPKTSNECRPSTMLSRVAATQRITGCADPALDDARCLHRYNKCCQPTSGLLKKSFRSADHESLLYDECGLAPWLSTRLKGPLGGDSNRKKPSGNHRLCFDTDPDPGSVRTSWNSIHR